MAKPKKTLGTLPESVEQAKENYEAYVAQTPGDFLFSKEALYQMAEEAIANRESFSYDPNADLMYQRYRDSYARQGSMAMEDTLGVAAAMNGGYGSSYGLLAGQQAYQSYLSRAADMVPELYELAYRRYSDETRALQERYDALSRERQAEYAAHQDAWSQYHAGAKELYQAYQDAQNRQDTLYQRLYDLIFQGYNPTQEEMAAAGMHPLVVAALREAYRQQQLQQEGY